jgi:hypothetical protein
VLVCSSSFMVMVMVTADRLRWSKGRILIVKRCTNRCKFLGLPAKPRTFVVHRIDLLFCCNGMRIRRRQFPIRLPYALCHKSGCRSRTKCVCDRDGTRAFSIRRHPIKTARPTSAITTRSHLLNTQLETDEGSHVVCCLKGSARNTLSCIHRALLAVHAGIRKFRQ